jgi:hypothetical protein
MTKGECVVGRIRETELLEASDGVERLHLAFL